MSLSTAFSLPGPSFDRSKYSRKPTKSAVSASVDTKQPVPESSETRITEPATGMESEMGMAESTWPKESASPDGSSAHSTETTSDDDDVHKLTDLTENSTDEDMPVLMADSCPGNLASTSEDAEPTPGDVHRILALLPSVMAAYGHKMAEINAEELQKINTKIEFISEQVPRLAEQVGRLHQQVEDMGQGMQAFLSAAQGNTEQHASTKASHEQSLEVSEKEDKSDIEITIKQEVEQQPAQDVGEQVKPQIKQEDISYGPATLITADNFSLDAIPAPSGEDANETPNARRLVSIRRIKNIRQVRVNDRMITVAQVDAWTCIVPHHNFRDGDLVVFCMIDAFLPASDVRFGRMVTCQTFEGLLGHRIRTERFGSYPNKLEVQGKIFPLSRFPEVNGEISYIRRALANGPDRKLSSAETSDLILAMYRKTDWAAELKVVKWVEPAPVNKPAEFPRLGSIPTRVLKKTDVSHYEDCPNLFISPKYRVHEYQESIKMDGASMTVYFVKNNTMKYHDLNQLPTPAEKIGPNTVLKTGRFGVCSKTVDLNELNVTDGDYWKVALLNDLPAKLAKLDRSIAIQGEICGPGINQNRENLTKAQFFVYSMWDITAQKHIDPRKVEDLAHKLGLSHVPVLQYVKIQKYAKNHEQLRKYANDKPGEGLVYKCVDDGRSFKVHSTQYKMLHNC